nr:hypothetical protein [Tanacetum cinerariifolium]
MFQSTWEDVTTRFRSINSFQRLTLKSPSPCIDLWLQIQIFDDHVNQATRYAIDHSAGGKLRNKSVEESWELIEDLALYDNKSWNDTRDFAKPFKTISLPQDVPSTSDRRLVGLENQVLSSTRSSPMEDPQSSSNPFKLVNSIETQNGSAFIQSEMPKKMKGLSLFILPYRLGDSKTIETLADLGSCMNLIPLHLLKTLKIGLSEETKNVLGLADRTKSYLIRIVRNVEVYARKLKLLKDYYFKDMEKDHVCPLIVGRGFLATGSAIIDCKKSKIAESDDMIDKQIDWNKPPKEGDDAWHIRIEMIDPDGEQFDRVFQPIPTTRKLSKKEKPSDIIDLKHFYDA